MGVYHVPGPQKIEHRRAAEDGPAMWSNQKAKLAAQVGDRSLGWHLEVLGCM